MAPARKCSGLLTWCKPGAPRSKPSVPVRPRCRGSLQSQAPDPRINKMAKHLDLEEQEQLADIKHFWNEYGNLISWVVIAVFGAIAAWNGWQYWERTQS